MPRYYVFDTQAQAVQAVASIDARARTMYRAQGYLVEPSGAVVGKRVQDGVTIMDAARTLTWFVPLQRVDGKWIVLHAEACPGHGFVIDARGTTVADYVGADLLTATVETALPEWFPVPAPYVAGVKA